MPPESPNILLLLTDQERADLTDPAASLPVETPNIDRLASEGVSFDRAYTPIGICTAARASLLTGHYPHTHGMLNNCHEADAIAPNLPREHVTFPELLSAAGYAVTYAGKWHVGRDQRPEDFKFRTVPGTGADDGREGLLAHQRDCGVDPEAVELRDVVTADYGGDEIVISGTTSLPPEATWTHYLADRTVEHLESLAAGEFGDESPSPDRPFFHRTDFEGPHHPYVVPEPYASLYDPDDLEPWGNFDESFDGKPWVHEALLARRGVEAFDWETWAAVVSNYFGFVTFIDEQIGRILDALEDLGLAEETVTIHAADHGDMTGSHRQFNKGPAMYEEVYRVPLHVRWPANDRFEPGSRREEFVRLHDLMATVLEIAGVEPPADVDSRNLLALLEGRAPDDWPEHVCAEYHGDEFGLYSQRMVRTDRHKLVYNAFDVDELYDLAADPHELENLIDDPASEGVRRDLSDRLTDWMAETDDPMARWTTWALERRERG